MQSPKLVRNVRNRIKIVSYFLSKSTQHDRSSIPSVISPKGKFLSGVLIFYGGSVVCYDIYFIGFSKEVLLLHFMRLRLGKVGCFEKVNLKVKRVGINQ